MSRIRSNAFKEMKSGPGTRQEFDDNFLHSGYRRKIFVATDPEISQKSPPRRGRVALSLVPIPIDNDSFGTLMYENLEGGLEEIELEKGKFYYVPPGTPYQITPRGRGALEMFYPTSNPTHWLDEEILASDYFDQHPSKAPAKE